MVSCPQIRLSVGLEDTQDLLDDVTQALEVYYYTIELIVCFVLCVCVCVRVRACVCVWCVCVCTT